MNTEARRLLRTHRYGTLCTLSVKLDGYPFGSIAPYTVDHDGSLIIYISALAEHTKNIAADPRVSLITHDPASSAIQMQGRVTVSGTAQPEITSERYFRQFPDALQLATLDFSFYRIIPRAIRYIGGIGRIHWLDEQRWSTPAPQAFTKQEVHWLTDINTRQNAVLKTLLSQQHNTATGVAIGADCDGLDVKSGETMLRIEFANTLSKPEQLSDLSSLI